MCVKITVPLVRDVLMLGLGAAGMTHELFFVPAPDMTRVTVSLLLLAGSAAVNTYWLARNTPPTPTPTAVSPPSSPPASSSPPSLPPS